MILAALGPGKVEIENALFSEDTRIMLKALQVLGFDATADSERATITVTGRNGRIPSTGAALDVGNSGTSARFLTAFCCLAREGTFRIDGVEQMRQRPIRGLVEALNSAGAHIQTSSAGGIPLEIMGKGLNGGPVAVDATGSSQVLSALLMVAPHTAEGLDLRLSNTRVRKPYVELTLAMMRQFGIPAEALKSGPDFFRMQSVSDPVQGPDHYGVEPDASAASYFAALPAVAGGRVGIEGVRLDGLQGDAAFARVIEDLGCRLRQSSDGLELSRPEPTSGLSGYTGDFFQISDTFLTLAAIAPLLGGPTTITGIGHTRKQETDRVAAAATELKKLGQEVDETEDTLTIHPRPLRPAEVDTYDDHRIAMSFAILGCHDLYGDGRPWLTIRNPATCAKTFPSFFQQLEDLRRNS
jgi:3-phosphoshikimate 1-carboxyvinyltransferase